MIKTASLAAFLAASAFALVPVIGPHEVVQG
jgi:hypothetical protein